MRENGPIKYLDPASWPDVRLPDEMRRLRVSRGQSCRTLPWVTCPVEGREYRMHDITPVTPVETEYACPACGEAIKKDIFTTAGWKTLVFDIKREPGKGMKLFSLKGHSMLWSAHSWLKLAIRPLRAMRGYAVC